MAGKNVLWLRSIPSTKPDERLWRSVKYEEVYLRAYDSVSEARASIGRYFDFYNGRRPHASLDGNTPDQAYFNPRCPSAWQPNPGRDST